MMMAAAEADVESASVATPAAAGSDTKPEETLDHVKDAQGGDSPAVDEQQDAEQTVPTSEGKESSQTPNKEGKGGRNKGSRGNRGRRDRYMAGGNAHMMPHIQMVPHYGPPMSGYGGQGGMVGGMPMEETYSKTNLYISGLAPTVTDEELTQMFAEHGTIVSVKAVMDHVTNQCKGYGFVLFEKPGSAQRAVAAMKEKDVMCTFAKESFATKARQQQNDFDSTNLYMANLPQAWTEDDLMHMLERHGTVMSARVLRDARGLSRGVGFARMETREQCEKIIAQFGEDWILPGCVNPLQIRFADTETQKRNRMRKNRLREGLPMMAGPGQMMLLPGMLPGSPQQGAAAYPYAMSMGVVPGQPTNWHMYAVPYGMPEGEQGNGVGGQGPGSPSIMSQMSTQLQNLALGPGPIPVMPMYGPPQGYYGQYSAPPQRVSQDSASKE